MTALKSERRIYLWRMTPHPTPKDAPNVKLETIFDLLKDAFDNKRAFAFVDAKGKVVPSLETAENCIFIADIKIVGKTYQLLINRGDPDIAHPSFINPEARTVKNVPPGTGEVQGWSAHMVINTKPDADGRHRAAFERIQNVSSTLVQRYLDALLDQATDGKDEYTYKKSIQKNKKTIVEDRPYKLRLGINKVPSESLQNDIKIGALTAVTLIRSDPKYSGPGNPTLVNSIKEKLTIRTKKLEKETALKYIKELTQWGKNNEYDEVQFSIQDLPGDTSSNPRFAIEKADALDTIYSRTHRITSFGKLLETCYQTIEDEIASKMAKELSNESLWT